MNNFTIRTKLLYKIIEIAFLRVYDSYGLKTERRFWGNEYNPRSRDSSTCTYNYDIVLKFAPYGKQGLQALSGAACATYLPQAF